MKKEKHKPLSEQLFAICQRDRLMTNEMSTLIRKITALEYRNKKLSVENDHYRKTMREDMGELLRQNEALANALKAEQLKKN